jgi:hypothetical protein
MTVDHIIPRSKGGGSFQWNLAPACNPCNRSKGNKDYFDWWIKSGFYDRDRHYQILEIMSDRRSLVEQLESIKENPSFRLAWEKRNCGKF